jgi:arsenate reductase (thioredoxin)
MAPGKRTEPQNILFVCVGNSCRSQMAEAFVNQLGGNEVRGWSAGSRPLGEIVWGTTEVMREKGIALEGHWSKGLNEVPLRQMDVIVTLGCEVSCPVPPSFAGRVAEWNIPDPYGADLTRYREVRDLIEAQVAQLLAELGCTLSTKTV